MRNNIEEFCEKFILRNIKSNEDILKEALRVIATLDYTKTKDIEIYEKNKKEIYNGMKKVSEQLELGHFPGDEDFFYRVFLTGKDLDLLKLIYQLYSYDNRNLPIVPEYIIDSYKEDIDKSYNILITEFEKYTGCLKKIIDQNKKITLLTQNYIFYTVFKYYFKDNLKVNVLNQTIYSKVILKDKFDLVISLPDYGIKNPLDNRYAYITEISETIAIENLIETISVNGKLVIIIPSKFTFAGGRFKKLRRYIFSNKFLEEIAILPDGILKPATSVSVNQLTLSNNNSEVEISDKILKNNTLVIGKNTKFSYNEFKQKDDWNVKIHLNDTIPEMKKFSNSKVIKTKLKNIAQVFRGKSILKDKLKPGDKYILNISNIDTGVVDLKNMDTIDEEERKLLRYKVLENDIVITCRGTVNKVAIFPKTDKFVLASANVIVVRLNKEVIPIYLKIFLESPTGEILIKSLQRGTTLMNINPNDLKELEVPLIDLSTQQKLTDKYIEGFNEYRCNLDKINKKWLNTKEEIFKSCF